MIVTGTDASGWARGKNIMGGDEAYFPASYVEVVAQPEMLVEVIHDFDPKNVQYLPKALVVIELHRGELILVTGTHVSGWWRGCNVTGGPEGYFPGDYVRCITQPSLERLQCYRWTGGLFPRGLRSLHHSTISGGDIYQNLWEASEGGDHETPRWCF